MTKVLGGVTENYTYDNANKLTAAGSKTYTYDNAGNTTGVSWSGGSISLSWDAESRLKSETTGGTTVNYVFNGLGQRVQKTGGATATYTLADDAIDSQVLSDGAAIYAHGVSGILSENRGGTSKFYHSDALGSVRALTNTSGAVTDSKSTDAFGLVVTSTGSTPTPFGFAGSHGYQQDSETGLMRLGHRMYDASTGRFISRDPICDGYNWYIYVGNDPVQRIDPKGLFAVLVLILAAIAVIDVIAGPAGPKPDPGYRPPPGPGQLIGGFIPGAGAVIGVIGIINSPPQSVDEMPIIKGIPSLGGGSGSGGGLVRGAPSGEPPSTIARPGVDIKPVDGIVMPGRGISVVSDPGLLHPRYPDPYPVIGIPGGLEVLPVGKPGHFEICPITPMPVSEYQGLLNQIVFGSKL